MVGIVVATEDNICEGVNISRSCTPATDLSLPAVTNISLLEVSLQSNILDDIEDDKEFLYWLTGATLSGLLFVIVGSLCLWAAARVVFNLYNPAGQAFDCLLTTEPSHIIVNLYR